MIVVTITVCIIMITLISLFAEFRVAQANQQSFEAQTHSINTHRDAYTMYHVLLDIYDNDEDKIQEIVDKKQEELF